MNDIDTHEYLQAIDQIAEGRDWFSVVPEDARNIAGRVKATTTTDLKAIVESDDSVVAEFAKKELAERALSDTHVDGNPSFLESYKPYDSTGGSLHEVLTASDPVEKWIADFVASDNPKFDGKSKKERINMALGAYYAASKKEAVDLSLRRDSKIVRIVTESNDEPLIRFFVESIEGVASRSMLDIKDLWETFVHDLTEAAVTLGSVGQVKCIKPWGACTVGKVYKGVWRQAARSSQLRLDLDLSLPGATSAPSIFFDKTNKQVSVPKQFQLL